jgi:hypothetical protein
MTISLLDGQSHRLVSGTSLTRRHSPEPVFLSLSDLLIKYFSLYRINTESCTVYKGVRGVPHHVQGRVMVGDRRDREAGEVA